MYMRNKTPLVPPYKILCGSGDLGGPDRVEREKIFQHTLSHLQCLSETDKIDYVLKLPRGIRGLGAVNDMMCNAAFKLLQLVPKDKKDVAEAIFDRSMLISRPPCVG
jgi:hypothetical protein